MLLFVPLYSYISVRPSSRNNCRNAECIIINLDISDIYCSPFTRNNYIYNLITPADTSHGNLHAFCWLLETNFLIFSEIKVLKQKLRQNFKTYFKPLHLCKLGLDPCSLKWTYAPELLRCPYISLSTVNTKLEHVHSVDHIRDSDFFLGNGLKLLNRFIKIRVSFGTGLGLRAK